MSSSLSQFSCLDDVIQVIYHLNRRLFLLSKVQDDNWLLHIGLLGDSRWWRGKWDEDDVLAAAESEDERVKLSERLLEFIVQGELFLSGWTKESTTFKLILGPSSEKPTHVQLSEISTDEAASYATEVFCSIAREAQSRRCQLHGSSSYPVGISTTYLDDSPASSSSKPIANRGSETSSKKREETKSKRVSEQPAPSKKRKERKEEAKSPDPDTKTTTAKIAPKPMKGASLANPTKKARKYQAVQFDSDED
ncbi:hypothetical protein F5878DRAFT_376790 [Lentinula raphanica]|uniref:Uncharacterized protein n=1 Tax=Lentinula raphanica TaxID=153919 RepID=A0AA38P0I5_9AGAR|nr:hypothetical protein F5878DRAFT_376790 [Lentinula raphanica]